MADAYWRYPEAPRQQPLQQQQQLPPQAMASFPGKRSRAEFDVPGGPELSSYHQLEEDRGPARVIRDSESISASYDQYLRNASLMTYGGAQSARTIGAGVPTRPIDDPHVVSLGTLDQGAALRERNIRNVSGRAEVSLPSDATNTLFVEGLPYSCTRREVAHIFRPFVGYKEVRLVNKEPRHPGQDPLVLGFVDFISPAHAATAMDALQGYVFDENDRDSVRLRFQFARYPGARSGGGHRGKR